MHNFKGGDRVRRIKESFNDVKVGQEYIVAPDSDSFALKLVGYSGTYTAKSFELVTRTELTDEELAAEYRKNYTRQVEIRNLLLDREYSIDFGGVALRRTTPRPVKITKTVTTTKEI